jgi:bifunctional DNA-binding transcriptional regulator/antitoxin component of YhaV-PrlF toxin-antitoxin module
MLSEATVQLRDRGVVTLPKALRDRYGLAAGDALRVLDLDGVFVMTPLAPMVPELAREIERLRLEAGLSTEELLDGLRRERERYARERYGVETGDASSPPQGDSTDRNG